MTEKRFLEDVSNEDLLVKLRRANAGMTEAITEEILFRATYFKPGVEDENLPNIVNVIFSDNNAPKIEYTDPLPKSGVGFKEIWDDAGVTPIGAEYTHYWDVIREPASEEEFFAEVEKTAKYFYSEIYDVCELCGGITKNDICKECSK